MAEADPFLLLDHLGPAGQRARTRPRARRGIRTAASRPCSYILDGEIAHHDTNGGGGVIAEGDTQWMTAGGGILHDELPTERMYRGGGPFARRAAVGQPAAGAQDDARRATSRSPRDALRLLTSDDGGALIRLIAGDIAGFDGPGRHPHADHLRARDPRSRRPALGAVESARSARSPTC